MTDPPDPDSRYAVLPQDLRLARRSGASIGEIQIARARAYIARLEAELASNARGLAASARRHKQRALREWRAHLANLHADTRDDDAHRVAAE